MTGLLSRFYKPKPKTTAAQQTVNTAPATGAWSLAMDTYHLQWSIKEAEALVNCENKSPIYATIHTEDGPQSYQTLILSFDLESSTLTLDNFYPHVSISMLYRAGAFELNIPYAANQQLRLRCIAIGESGAYAREAITIKVLEKTAAAPTHNENTIIFDTHLAPSVEVLIPMQDQLRGPLCRISPYEFEMTCLKLFGKNLRNVTAECTICFSDEFTFHSSFKIKDSKTLRKPHNHTKILGTFTRVDAQKREQLEAFLNILKIPQV